MWCVLVFWELDVSLVLLEAPVLIKHTWAANPRCVTEHKDTYSFV